MITWTDAAKEVLEDYCRRTRENLRDSGADPDEVIDDLRRHVDEEINAAQLTLVTEEEMRRILARVGEPEKSAEGPKQPQPDPAPTTEPRKRPGTFFLIAAFLLGVVLPAGTLIFELATGLSASVLFDPVPNWIQLIAVALVPITNLWLGVIAIRGRTRFPQIVGWLSGAMLAVCTYYSVLYLPFVPLAGIGLIFYGLGLVPMSPYFALIFVALLRSAAARQAGVTLPSMKRPYLITLAVLILLQVPTGLTYYGTAAATSEDAGTRKHGLAILRAVGDRDLLLRNCYFGSSGSDWPFDPVRAISSGNKSVTGEQAREIFYRVTGKPFNAVTLPSVYKRYGSWMGMDRDFAWDEGLGGDSVAGVVKGLSLASSRLDAVAEPDAVTAYCEWTLEFKNVSSVQREARAQILLPPGGVVSRLTLWVNGEEREAAFGGRSDVRAAYKQVAVAQRRDPVLVTTCGPDRVLMQCFPVPADGGTMKVRVGITAPLVLNSLDHGRFLWPKFVERNFRIAPDFKFSAWIDSPQKLTTSAKELAGENSGGKVTLHGTIAEANLADVVIERSPEIRSVWTPALETNQIILQHIEEAEAQHVPRIVMVVDGSVGMAGSRREIADAIGKLAPGCEVSVLVGNDDAEKLFAVPGQLDEAGVKTLTSEMRHLHCGGGRDNLPALVEAWDEAANSEGAVIIWIHDAQPELLSPTDSLQQRIERSGRRVPIYDLQVHAGPNRIAEKFDELNTFKRVPPVSDSAGGDLENLLQVLTGKVRQYRIVREKADADKAADGGKRVSRHIERLWARDEARKLASARQRDEAIRLAAKQQLVTPVTGAVVLETKQQFVANGLEPVSPESVPMVPEPGMVTLWILAGGCLAWRRWRARRLTACSRE